MSEMNRILGFLLAFVLLFAVVPSNSAYAERESALIETIYYQDGSYAVITLTEERSAEKESTFARAFSYIRNGSKTYTYYNSSGVTEWSATLNASFTYDGSTATCTAANCQVTIYNNAWYVVSNSSSYSGNTATANVTMGYRLLGNTVGTKSITITLSCDANGNLS